jgi:putative transposase
MPYTRLFYHLIWSTKNRLPLIIPELEQKLFPYIHQKANELDCKLLAVNGWEDHVHLVLEISPKLSVSDVVKRLKGASSHEFEELFWQRGYGALTISERNLPAAIDYVNRQKEHHQEGNIYKKLERCDDGSFVREESIGYETDIQDIF